jgi:hypothetical protein
MNRHMNSSGDPFEIWIPDGGFEIQRRMVKASDGGSVVAECLGPRWSSDDLMLDRPLHRQPCLHRILADCSHDQIVKMASLYGRLIATVSRSPACHSANQ